MAFRFSLATVLKLRQSIEDREERALQKVQADIARVHNQIEALNTQIANVRRQCQSTLLELTPAAHLHVLLTQTQSAEDAKKALYQQLQVLEQQRQQQLAIYQAAHRDRETLTNMFDEQRGLYEQDQARREQKTLDDIFMARHHRS